MANAPISTFLSKQNKTNKKTKILNKSYFLLLFIGLVASLHQQVAREGYSSQE